MNYTEFKINITPYSEENVEIIIAQLSELGFESFMEDNETLLAYIKSNMVNPQSDFFSSIHLPKSVEVTYSCQEIEDKDWNEEWESNFEPIIVENRCLVRASFHNNLPKLDYEIVIDPKMAFGTGHHQTTHLMVAHILKANFTNLRVLDMGCGTGILSILAEKRNAREIVAIDNDEWSYNNTLENIKTNNCSRIKPFLGDAKLLENQHFDVILANINLNILLADLPTYYNCLNQNGTIAMSGILVTDIDTLKSKAEELKLKFIEANTRDNWTEVLFSK